MPGPASIFRPLALAAWLVALLALSGCDSDAENGDDRQGKVPLEIVEEHPTPSPAAEGRAGEGKRPAGNAP